jgi:hypothetical protein
MLIHKTLERYAEILILNSAAFQSHSADIPTDLNGEMYCFERNLKYTARTPGHPMRDCYVMHPKLLTSRTHGTTRRPNRIVQKT